MKNSKTKKSLEEGKKNYFKRNRLFATTRIAIYAVPLLLLTIYVLVIQEPVSNTVWIDILYVIAISIVIIIAFLFFQWHEDIDLEEKQYELKKELKENLLKIQKFQKEFEDTDDFFEGYPVPKKIKRLELRNEQIDTGFKVLDM